MEVFLYLAVALAFTAAFLILMTRAAKAGRPVVAAFLGAMALATPITYPLSLMRGGVVSAPVGLLTILGMVALVALLAHRAYRSGRRASR